MNHQETKISNELRKFIIQDNYNEIEENDDDEYVKRSKIGCVQIVPKVPLSFKEVMKSVRKRKINKDVMLLWDKEHGLEGQSYYFKQKLLKRLKPKPEKPQITIFAGMWASIGFSMGIMLLIKSIK